MQREPIRPRRESSKLESYESSAKNLSPRKFRVKEENDAASISEKFENFDKVREQILPLCSERYQS